MTSPCCSRSRAYTSLSAGQLPGGDAVAAGVFSMIQSEAFWRAVREALP